MADEAMPDQIDSGPVRTQMDELMDRLRSRVLELRDMPVLQITFAQGNWDNPIIAALENCAVEFTSKSGDLWQALISSVHTNGFTYYLWDESRDDWGGKSEFIPFNMLREITYL